MNKQPIIFITGNQNKVTWTKRYLTVPFTHTHLELTEIQSLDIQKVTEHKVTEAFRILKQPVFVEDTALIFHALGKLPGTFIKWFHDELGNDGLCTLLYNKDRKATAIVTYGFYDGKNVKFFQGITHGSISESPRGTNGFGWNPIFIPEGHTRTYSEMTDEEVDLCNARSIATKKLNEYLLTYEQ